MVLGQSTALNVLGMVMITVLLVVGLWPASSERVYRFMCILAALSLLVLVLEHT